MDDPASKISRLIADKQGRLEALHPEFGTNPTVNYLRLPKPFIAGDVYFADTGDCAIGVIVTLKCVETGLRRTVNTNFLGSFEFRDVIENGEYELTVASEGYQPLALSARVKGGINFGELALEKA